MLFPAPLFNSSEAPIRPPARAIAAERLVEHLARAGFVVMKRPLASAPSTAGHLREQQVIA